jgi:hypothetical protein
MIISIQANVEGTVGRSAGRGSMTARERWRDIGVVHMWDLLPWPHCSLSKMLLRNVLLNVL